MRSNSADDARIAAAVTAAEQRTSAEFAVVVVASSDDYAGFPLVWAGAAAVLGSIVAAMVWPRLPALDLATLTGGAYLVAALLLALVPVPAWLAPPFLRRRRSAAMADLQFAARVAQRTRDGAGLLLFLSQAEHAVEIRVDRAIAARLPADTWSAVVDGLASAARGGRLADGIITAVAACADVLAPHFPPRPGQENELPDRAALP